LSHFFANSGLKLKSQGEKRKPLAFLLLFGLCGLSFCSLGTLIFNEFLRKSGFKKGPKGIKRESRWPFQGFRPSAFDGFLFFYLKKAKLEPLFCQYRLKIQVPREKRESPWPFYNFFGLCGLSFYSLGT